MLQPWIPLLLLPISLCLYDDPDVVQETLRTMLHFEKMPSDVKPIPLTVPSKQSLRYMETLFRNFVEEDGSDDGNIVRSIEPSVGKVDGQEVLIFDISHLGDEKIMKGELHFHLRRRGVSGRRARSLTARSLCTNEYCTEGQFLHQLGRQDDSVLWDTTKGLVESQALGAKQIIYRISRKDVKMRSYSEMVRKSSPFLLVFSKADNTIDAEKVRQGAEAAKRRRRDAGSYYQYNTDEAATTRDYNQIPNDIEALRQRAIGVTKAAKKLRPHRKHKERKDDIWEGFGDEEEETATSTMKTIQSNDVRVVLLGEGKKNQVCKQNSMYVDFIELGWQDFVIAPTFFEAGHCAGTCPNPLPRSTNPSNHAVLQSLFLPRGGEACCAADSTRSLTVLYRDESGRVSIRNFPRMIVDSCACI